MLNPNPDAGQTNWTYNASAIMYGIYWLISALPYFFLDKKRPGPDIPIGANVYMEGLVQAKEALQLAKKLPQAWLYIIGFFLYCDGINSCGTLIGNLQAQYLSYNVLSSNLFALAQAVSGMIGCLAFWWIQLYFKLETKTMLQFSNFLTLLMYAWALVGLVSPSMGYKSSGEFWFYNIGYGIWTSPFWALQNTYLSDLIPNRKAYLFFSLFGIMNKASAFIGPIVNFFITVVAKGNSDYIAFIPCTILALVGFIMIQYTNPATARLDILAFEEAEREFEGERLSRIKPKVGKVGTISH
ncbi:autophagy-related protein 22-like protein [Chytriomyces sp. MP71]|nr:autophagy-related protein 22-like protein [Chytriomyces sp. MP71]